MGHTQICAGIFERREKARLIERSWAKLFSPYVVLKTTKKPFLICGDGFFSLFCYIYNNLKEGILHTKYFVSSPDQKK